MKIRLRRSFATSAAVIAAWMTVNPVAASTFEKCVAGLRVEVLKAGIKPDIVNAAFRDIKFDEKAVRFSRTQPEYRWAIWDYMASLVDDVRIADGLRMMKIHQQILRDVEKAFGVDRFILAALWGVESDYGKEMGEFFLPHALANGVCAGRKAAVFKTELMQVLRIAAAGNVKLEDLRGSWAGAFGQTQFIPSTYRRLAVDFDGDGRKDTIHSIPDTLASAANFLQKAGWQPGVRWGFEVSVPRSYAGPIGRAKKAAISHWAKQGISRADGSLMPKSGLFALIMPAGRFGPAFLVSRNFDVLYSYNAAESYALAISHLSDRLDGRGPFKIAWPTDDPGLTRAQRKRLQQLLIDWGYYKGEADGRVGHLTVAAIRQAERKVGLKPIGRPGTRI
jgi:lytic murein transglycosylase